jgi:maltose O-acetyltransferase
MNGGFKMTEKEKQQAGELYNASDRELFNERIKAKKLCAEYNAVECNDFQKRERILDRLVALRGENTVIEPNFFCDYGYNIVIGDNFYANHNLVILDCADIEFGNNVFIGPNCGFYAAEHPIDANLRNQGLESAKPIKVGSNVWIGGGVTVIGGVTIGDNVVIGAGSVVTKDIPSNCVAVGNPCAPTKTLEPAAAAEAAAEKPAEKKPEPAEKKPAPEEKPKSRRIEIRRID